MNKKGNIFLGIVFGVIIWLFGILFLPFIADDITTTRVALECADAASISGGTMVNCLTIDLVIPLFIWFLVSLALGYLIGGSR